MSKIKLKRCPFCDEELEVVGRGHYYTHKINGCILQHLCFETDYKETIDRWNTRKPLQEIVERLEEDSKHWNKKKKEALKNRELEEANRYDAFEIADNHLINFVKEVGGMND